MNQLIEFLWSSVQLGALISIPLMALHWAATHTWATITFSEKGNLSETKGLVLYPLKRSLDKALVNMSDSFVANLTVNLLVLGVVVFSVIYGFTTFAPTSVYYDFPLSAKLSMFTGIVFAIFFGKPIPDIGEAIFNCNRCMPSVWVGLPIMIYGLVNFIMSGHYTDLYFFPYAILMVCIVSFFTTMIGHIVAALSK